MNAHQRRVARRRGDRVPMDGRRALKEAIMDCGLRFWREHGRAPATHEDFAEGARLLLFADAPAIHGRADAEALYGVGSEWADIAEYFANRHRDVTVFTLDPTQPRRSLFEEGVRNAVARSGFE